MFLNTFRKQFRNHWAIPMMMGMMVCATFPCFAKPAPKPVAASLVHFTGHEVSIGKPHAPITVIMYYSLTCPHCYEYQKDELPKIKEEFINKGLVRFIFRDFPTDSSAVKAAKIAWCLGKDHYLSIAHKLLETQIQWVPMDVAKIKEADANLKTIANTLGITDKDYQKCLANKEVEEAILQSSFQAQREHQIDAAPAFLVNGKIYDGILTVEGIEKMLRAMKIYA